MRIGICDDETQYLSYLNCEINNYCIDKKNTIIETISPADLAFHLDCFNCPYDILVMDIDMGEFNGMAFAKTINTINSNCIIIFISNHLHYAMDVYEVQHIYFVLKSDAKNRLPKALDKAIAIYEERQSLLLTIHYQSVNYTIPIMDITYIEAMGHYLYIHDLKQSYTCISTLKKLSEELPDSLVKCHKSFIVNLSHLRSISRSNCTLTTNITIPVSQTYSKTFQDAYLNYVSQKLASK